MPQYLAPLAVIELAFDPIARIGDWYVRLETIGLALVLLGGLLLAARIAGRTPLDRSRPADERDPGTGERNHLRRDDLLYVVVAALPGAVLGGRIGYGLLHLDFYAADPGALLDPGQGSLQLSLAVVGGAVSGSIVAALLDAPVGRWLHALALPLLFVLAAGKAVLVLGGDGQGVPSDLPWATAYTGPGPWGSLAPDLPSHPAQAYEAVATAAVLVVLAAVLASGGFRRRNGAAFLAAVGLWALARAAVATTWRDPAVVGPLGMDQAISVAIAAGAVLAMAAVSLRTRGRPLPAAPAEGPGGGMHPPGAAGRPGGGGPGTTADGLDWPDPTARPRF